MLLLRQLTILQRLILMLILAAIGTFVFASFSILEQRSNLQHQQNKQIREQLDTGVSLLNALASTEIPPKTIIEGLKYGQSGSFVLLGPNGNPLGKTDALSSKVSRSQWQKLAASVRSNGYAETQVEVSFQGKTDTLIIGAKPAANHVLATWGLESEINETMISLAVNYLIIMLIISLPIFGFFLVLNRSISQPLGQAITAMENIARGDADLTQRLDTSGRDEVAQLSLAFNEFVSNLGQTISQLQPLGSNLDQESGRLQQAVQDANDSAEHVHRETSAVAVAVKQMLTTTQEMAANTQHAADSAASVRVQADTSLEMMSHTTQKIRVLGQELSQSRTVTESLEHASNRIGDILNVIQGISEQTNLLALNAAIEAARAGAQGRGFAVVADEVRALANRTQSSTEQIQLIIKEIQQGVTAVLTSNQTTQEQSKQLQQQADNVAEAMEAILALVNQISDMNTQLASATEEQSLVTAEISRNVSNISELTEVSLQANQSNAKASSALQIMSEQITKGLGHFTA